MDILKKLGKLGVSALLLTLSYHNHPIRRRIVKTITAKEFDEKFDKMVKI